MQFDDRTKDNVIYSTTHYLDFLWKAEGWWWITRIYIIG